MVVIPAGVFLMGWLSGRGSHDEQPAHPVRIRYSLPVSKYEVTQAEWHSVMGNNPSSFKGDRNPVEQVSWKDAKVFMQRLSARTGKAYRLLSESEREYAARADTWTPFHFGLMISPEHANYNGTYSYSGGPTGVFSKREAVSVGRFPAGFHDVAGNVMEWVEDRYHGWYPGMTTDGRASTIGSDCSERDLRGGSWDNRPWDLRSAARIRYHIAYRSNFIGLRVARMLL